MFEVEFCGYTDTGRIRTNNEDAYVVQYIWDDKHILAVAIDGVGGYEGGEVAAGLAQKHIVAYLEDYAEGEPADLLKKAVVNANNIIYDARKQMYQYENMSCVLTAALFEIEKRSVHMAHIGDTRLYQFCNNTLTKLSHDHSLVGLREERGDLTEEEAMHHPMRNVISNVMGEDFLDFSTSKVETASFPIFNNSTYLLCSDGLYDMVTSHQITDVLQNEADVNEKAQRLIYAANDAGGKDNITVVLVSLKGDENIVNEIIRPVADNEDTTIDTSKPDSTRCFSYPDVLYLVAILLGATIVSILGMILGRIY